MANEMKMLRMIGSDGIEVLVEENAAMRSQTIRHLIEDDCVDSSIPIPKVTSSILSDVFHYCKKHLECSLLSANELKNFDNSFVDVDVKILHDLLLATHYLDVEDLLDLLCQRAADLMRGKTPAEIRQIFNIVGDLTIDEEEELRMEYSWAFQ